MTDLTTVASLPRRLSPLTRPATGTARLLITQATMEVRRYRRIPEYFIGVVVLPIILYAMFGLRDAGKVLPLGTDVGAMMFVSIGCYGVVSEALFSFGGELATERSKGWLRRLRATPMPMWVYFAGKVALNLVFTLVSLRRDGCRGGRCRARHLRPVEVDRHQHDPPDWGCRVLDDGLRDRLLGQAACGLDHRQT